MLIGAGLSSSAAFETLIGTVVSGLYNHAEIPAVTIAQTGRYAENVYFGKPSGLMDRWHVPSAAWFILILKMKKDRR